MTILEIKSDISLKHMNPQIQIPLAIKAILSYVMLASANSRMRMKKANKSYYEYSSDLRNCMKGS